MQKYLEKLEFPKILEILSNFAITAIGKELAHSLIPCTNLKEANQKLAETTESYILLYRKGIPPLVEIPNITIYLKTLESNGTLSATALLQLAHILKLARELKEYFSSDIDTSFCFYLTNLFSNLYTNPKIEDSIFLSILDENTIDDHASQNLWLIRKEIQKTEADIRKKLTSYLHASYIQEPVITIRAERFVIPVKQEQRNEVNGFTHDISASGSTVFIEPTTIFEMNNILNELKLKEKIEIENILKQLSNLFFPITEELKQNINFIGKIDFAFAKAKYAKSIEATEPILHEEKYIDFKNSRHPLIAPEKVVPVTISLGKNFSCLIITGPNTGGKTVTLKTVGLLCAMSASGLYIPVAEKSSTCIFDGIYADIGDEQSIQESLSTFSSHITNIIEILNVSTSNSLILLDELGSGTDPIEGSSLAISILQAFSNRGCLTISTTHYPEVKNFALVTDNFENASSEFDVENLKPTYKLLIGVPGQSNAFSISQKLGLDPNILDYAKSLINSDRISIEEILKNIYDDKKLIEEEKEKTLKNSKRIEELKISLENQRKLFESEEKEAIFKAKEKAREIFISAKEEADEIIHLLENSTSKSEANILRKKIKSKIEETIPVSSSSASSLNINEIAIGANVFIKSLQTQGTILSLPNKSKKVQVQVRKLKNIFSIT